MVWLLLCLFDDDDCLSYRSNGNTDESMKYAILLGSWMNSAAGAKYCPLRTNTLMTTSLCPARAIAFSRHVRVKLLVKIKRPGCTAANF